MLPRAIVAHSGFFGVDVNDAAMSDPASGEEVRMILHSQVLATFASFV